jgi:hypothetical protein
MVKVAKGEADLQTNVIAFHLLSGKPQRSSGFLDWAADAFVFGGLDDFEQEIEDVVAAQEAPQLAANWCNSVLVPQFETREQALHSVDVETRQRIEQAFAEFTKQLSSIQDPFVGMDTATAPPTGTGNASGQGGPGGSPVPSIAGGGAGGAGVSGAGAAGVTMPTSSGAGAGLTAPAAAGITPPHIAAPLPAATATPAAGGAGITRPSGLPAGAGWIPPGVPLPSGWSADPATGEVLPKGWSVDPTTGLPTAPTGSAGGRPVLGGGFDPARDIHENSDGSVSLGPDRGLTISRESGGAKGTFTLTDTDSAGQRHTYTVHFDAHGNPVVAEQRPDTAAAGATDLAGASSVGAASSLDLGAGAGAGPGPGAGAGDVGAGGVGAGGLGAGGLGSGGLGSAAGLGAAGGIGAGAAPTAAAPSVHGGAGPLPPGVHVGADNAMSASSAAASGPASPEAGTAAPGPEQGGHAGGGVGAMPLGGAGARGGGGSQEQESSRRYQQHGDLVGEDELEEWQRMGPVIGEQ